MIRSILLAIILIILVIIGLGMYLQPDDLSQCGKTPGTDTNCRAVDAIVAVSGGDTKARTDMAVDLYKNGWAKTLIFSGAAQDKTGPSNAAVMKEIAINAGVPDGTIYIDEYSETTKQNAENSQTIFTKLNIKSIILVTSGYHQRRASLEFNKRTHNVTILNHPVKTDKDWSFWWWTNPVGWWLAISEFVKIIGFYVFGIWQ